jgi:hypothetical protein
MGAALGGGREGGWGRELLRSRGQKRFVEEVRRMDETSGNGMGSGERGTSPKRKDRSGGMWGCRKGNTWDWTGRSAKE